MAAYFSHIPRVYGVIALQLKSSVMDNSYVQLVLENMLR